MKESLCGIDCSKCDYKDTCKGCNTKDCLLKSCVENKKISKCLCSKCSLKEGIIKEIKKLNIEGLNSLDTLYALSGSYINMEYTNEAGNKYKLLDDEKIYLGNQICQKEKCFGICVSKEMILICSYEENGINPEIVLYKKRNI